MKLSPGRVKPLAKVSLPSLGRSQPLPWKSLISRCSSNPDIPICNGLEHIYVCSQRRVTKLYFQVASKLLSEGLLLTALELHTELLETGRELPRFDVADPVFVAAIK